MKVLFVNAPFIKYNDKFKDIDFKIKTMSVIKKYQKPMGKILFKLLSNGLNLNCFRYGVRAGSRWPWTTSWPHGGPHYPFIMGYAAALLQEKGFEVNILDAVAEEQYSYENFIKQVKAEQADIVVVECSTPTIDIDLWIAEKISKFTDVALAGPHLVEKETEKINKEHPYIKYLLKGEYIYSALKMAQTKKEGIYESSVVEDLDSIPFPFRDYLSATKYYDPTMPTARPQLQIYASKGCPFKCSYCLWPQTMYQGKVTLRSPEKVAEEIKYCVEKYGYKSIFFDDDTFNLGTERISKLCDYLKEIGLPWTMMGRLDCSPNWLYDKMIDSGCVGMRFGVETFNIDVLKKINKGLERIDFLATLKYISEKYPELMIHLTMMKNMPGQTEEIHQKDIKILNDLGYTTCNIKRSYQLSSCVPFPGTKMYEDLIKEKGEDALKNFSKYDGGQDTIMKELNV